MKATKPEIIQEYFNIADACKYTGVCRDTIMQWKENGLKMKKVGRLYIVKRENVDSFLEDYENDVDDVDLDEVARKVSSMFNKKRRRK